MFCLSIVPVQSRYLCPWKDYRKSFCDVLAIHLPVRDHLFEKYNILPVHKLYIYDLIKFSLISYNNLHSSEFLNSFCVESRSNYNTRSTNIGLCKIPKFRSNLMKNSLQYRSVKLINALAKYGYSDLKLDSTQKVQSFAHNFKDKVLMFDSTLVNNLF